MTNEQKELFKVYCDLQSKEFREEIINYEPLKMPDVQYAIKVNFTWGWLRVYKRDNVIEWY
ncbi:hypothetical protein [Clostridium felsineum]|uniref:Uncharacterized protein n=1 Tax=Clostridium felsineum TaxID=36839 RepID=A0A1S8M2F6_9CLOT|nr:hypothetical protein [Clostridium felsineum]URZ06805.1 hypothetical protein CLROS_021380 [Clostridium felsineum]URZ11837.1 hypothetical protein CROST_025540 [Clostridium felsineum]